MIFFDTMIKQKWKTVPFIIAFFLFITLSLCAQNAMPSKPNITIITTGGTIASRTTAPMIEGHELVQAVPQLLDYADISVHEFSRIGSSQMTPDHWLRLAKLINKLLASSGVDGIVITHGTDTMEETAYFLNLTVKSDRPVVLVGSMRSSNEISADGPANLLNAIRVAASAKAAGHGVLVVLNEDISAARDVTKMDNRSTNTFQSTTFGHLGKVNPDTVVFYRKVLSPHTLESPFDITALDSLPRVDIISDFTGFDGAILSPYFAKKPAGLVIETFAGGRMSGGMRHALESNADSDLVIVISSRVPGGRISGEPNYSFPAILSKDLPAHKARILLMLSLARSNDPSSIKQFFDIY